MQLRCYTADVQSLGASLFAGQHDAPACSRAVIGQRGDLVGIYIGDELRKAGVGPAAGRIGYAARLCGMDIDAQHNPTGVALMNELGNVNTWMMVVDLETVGGGTVSFYANFLAKTVCEHDELRTFYGGRCYEGVRELKGYAQPSTSAGGAPHPPRFTLAEEAALVDTVFQQYDVATLEAILQYAGVWDWGCVPLKRQVRTVGMVPRPKPGVQPGVGHPSPPGPDQTSAVCGRSHRHLLRASGDQPLLRSAKVPLPAVHGALPSLLTPRPGATPVPRRSGLTLSSAVPMDVFDQLQRDAAQTLWDALINRPAELAQIAPMANFPRPEFLFNTKFAITYSRVGVKALADPQGLQRVCTACTDAAGGAGAGFSRGAMCSEGGCECKGCDSCIGRQFVCPQCGCTFARLWVYETGSSKSSIGRDADHSQVLPFTWAQEAAATQLDAAASAKAVVPGDPCRPLRSCVMVSYFGSAFCAACALGLPHGSKRCGSVLHAHKDRAGGENSQTQSPNYTLSIGGPRVLSMELRLPEVHVMVPESTTYQQGHGQNAEAHFHLTHGSQFTLAPEDEDLLPRDIGDGSIAMGSFYHCMETEVAANSVSCGLVFRDVTASAEVNVHTHNIIMAREKRDDFEHRVLARGLSNTPPWAHGFKGTRADALATARAWWGAQAPVYAERIRQPLAEALALWKDGHMGLEDGGTEDTAEAATAHAHAHAHAACNMGHATCNMHMHLHRPKHVHTEVAWHMHRQCTTHTPLTCAGNGCAGNGCGRQGIRRLEILHHRLGAATPIS